MTYAKLIRIWEHVGARHTRCRTCQSRIVWGIDDGGVYRPLDVDADPLRTERDATGRRYVVYEPDALHACRRRDRLP